MSCAREIVDARHYDGIELANAKSTSHSVKSVGRRQGTVAIKKLTNEEAAQLAEDLMITLGSDGGPVFSVLTGIDPFSEGMAKLMADIFDHHDLKAINQKAKMGLTTAALDFMIIGAWLSSRHSEGTKQ